MSCYEYRLLTPNNSRRLCQINEIANQYVKNWFVSDAAFSILKSFCMVVEYLTAVLGVTLGDYRPALETGLAGAMVRLSSYLLSAFSFLETYETLLR